MENLSTDVDGACRGRGVLAEICSDTADADGWGGTTCFLHGLIPPLQGWRGHLWWWVVASFRVHKSLSAAPHPPAPASHRPQLRCKSGNWAGRVGQKRKSALCLSEKLRTSCRLPSNLWGPQPTLRKNKSMLTIHIRKGPPVVLSMHLILRTPCTPQSTDLIAPAPTVLPHALRRSTRAAQRGDRRASEAPARPPRQHTSICTEPRVCTRPKPRPRLGTCLRCM